MPELPEVETIKLGLQKYLVGHKIEDVEIRVPKIFQGEIRKTSLAPRSLTSKESAKV